MPQERFTADRGVMGIVSIDIPLALAHASDQLFIVVPANHPTKGLGYILCPITRELLASEAPHVMRFIDDGVRRATAPHVPDRCAHDEYKGCVCDCADCTPHQAPDAEEILKRFGGEWLFNDPFTNQPTT